MQKMNLTEAQRVLFDLVGHNLFDKPLEINEGVDWNAVIGESIAQSVPLLAFEKYRELPMDEAIAGKLQAYLKRCTISNINCFRGHEYLHKLMTENGIPYCIIKGAASSSRYPDPLLRSMGDVDFYVPPEHIDAAREIFLAEGFEFDTHEHSYHMGMVKGALRLEMHFAPISAPGGEIGEIFTEYWSDICEKASLTKDVFSECVFPSDFHHGFILLTHLRSHMILRGVGLRHVCDWAVFVNALSDERFTELFEAKLKRVGLWRFAQIVSLASVILLGMPHRAWMGDDYATATALAEDISSGGNFGLREDSRTLDSVFVPAYTAGGVKKRGIRRAFATANAIVLRHWSAAKKCPLLYPVGWVYFTLRFMLKRITGKQKVSAIKSYKQSGKRADLYASLGIFETE